MIILDNTGQIVFVHPQLPKKLGFAQPVDKMRALEDLLSNVASQTIPSFEACQQAALTASELSCPLRDGRLLLLVARKMQIAKEDIETLWKEHYNDQGPDINGPMMDAFFVFCTCLKPQDQKFHIKFQNKLRTTISSIITGFAHEVRNPLAAILSLAEGAIHPQMDEDSVRALSRIPFLVERIENLIKTALSYGQPRPPRAGWHQIGTLIKQSVEMLAQANPEVSLDLLPKEHMAIPVWVDQDQTISILTNLILNALQEAGYGGVHLLIHPNPKLLGETQQYSWGPVVAIDVIDRGKGIQPSLQNHIFEPFFTTKSNGTGLGLAFARELARLNLGEVILLESSQRGSTFRLYLATHSPRDAAQTTLVANNT